MRGQITFRCAAPALTVTCYMDETGPKITGGYGGWDIVERPRRVALTQWNGKDPYKMEIGIILDGFIDDDEVEIEIAKLERMALPFNTEPPVIEVKGSAIPHDDLKWVVEDIDWGDALRKSNGRRVRQQGTIKLVQNVKADRLQLSAAKRIRNKAGRK